MNKKYKSKSIKKYKSIKLPQESLKFSIKLNKINNNNNNNNNKKLNKMIQKKIKKEIKMYKKTNKAPKNAEKVKNYFEINWVDHKGNLFGIEPKTTRVCDFLVNLARFGKKHNLINDFDSENIEFIAYKIKKSNVDQYALPNEYEWYHFVRDDIGIDSDDFEEIEPYISICGAALAAYHNNFNGRPEIYRTIFFHYDKSRYCFDPKYCEWTNEEERETEIWRRLI